MRVIAVIFTVGGLVIALAFALGVARDAAPQPEQAPHAVQTAPDCLPREGSVTLVDPDEVTAIRLDAALDRVDSWLDGHAPATANAWNRPASRAELVTLQRDLGVPLPSELVIALTRHNGARADGFTLPPAYRPLSARDILTTAIEMCERGAGRRDGDVPFAKGDAGVLYLAEGGVYRYPGGQLHAASLTDLLERTADRLDGGGSAEYRPDVDAIGTLRWVSE
ncbi:SMI1/KNR4 family protein [Actinokineospora enzanensis]|uniref:SMI1/KNR4 family protein n=1 Tax=Actinokineospora enzanensis TaxID=155975 RepID=UPI0012EB0DF0|nr:SMI1/KNR4 family protein [Actinokineospora enzanensis]